jgi:hypothetical protein
MAASVDDQIAKIQELVDGKIDEAKVYTDDGIEKASEEANLDQGIAGGTLQPLDPPPFDPTPYQTTEWDNDFERLWKDLEDWIRDLMTGYMDTYFPKLDACIQVQEDHWLCEVVGSGYMGIPNTVETQIWDRSRTREVLDAQRLSDEATAAWAARGFSIPNGALLAQSYAAQAASFDKNASHSREVAIKHMEISVDMTKVAIQEMTKLRIGMADALGNYIRAWLGLPAAAASIAGQKWDMNKFMRDSAAAYYNAMVNELRVNADYTLGIEKLVLTQNVEELHSRDKRIDRQVGSAMKAAEGMANIASSGIGAQNTLVANTSSTVQNSA